MFKLVVLSALLVVAAARPGHLETPLVYSAPAATVTVHESSLAHVGNVVKSVPSSISHHSNSVVHSHAHVVQDVVAPVVKTTSYTTKSLATPIVESYVDAAPVVQSYAHAAPVVQSYAAHNYAAAAPAVHAYTADIPAIQSYAAAAPAVHTYAAAAPVVHNYVSAAVPEAHTYGAAAHYPAVNSYAASAPLAYTSTGLW